MRQYRRNITIKVDKIIYYCNNIMTKCLIFFILYHEIFLYFYYHLLKYKVYLKNKKKQMQNNLAKSLNK